MSRRKRTPTDRHRRSERANSSAAPDIHEPVIGAAAIVKRTIASRKTPRAGAPSPDRRWMPDAKQLRTVFISCGLVLLNVIVFAKTLGFSFVSRDDPQAVSENLAIRSGLTVEGIRWAFTQTQTFYWQPLTWLSHMLDCQLFGLNSGWHHATNLVWHIANVVLLFLLLRRLTRFVWRSALAAALFAIHPLATESVAWVAGRRDLLSGFFSILAIWLYVIYARRSGWVRYLAVIVIAALALASKPMTVSLPIWMLLLDYWPLNRFRWNGSIRVALRANWPLVREKLPLLVMAGMETAVTITNIHAVMATLRIPLFPFHSRIAMGLSASAFYVYKLFWPFGLAPIGAYTAPVEWQIEGAALLFVGVTLLSLAIGRRAPYLITGWLWFLVGILPSLVFAEWRDQFMADHLTYLPIVGLFLIVVWGAADLLTRSSGQTDRRVAAVALLLPLAWCTSAQTNFWKDSTALYAHAIQVASRSDAVLREVCAAAVRDQSVGDRIAADYTKMVQADPLSARKHYVLGVVFSEQGRNDRALAEFAEAVRHDPTPRFRKAFGWAILAAGKPDRALEEFAEAFRVAPDDPDRDRAVAAVPGLHDRLRGVPPPAASRVFTPENGLELVAILVFLGVGLVAPHLGRAQFRRMENIVCRIARRPVLSMCVAGLFPLIARLLLLPLYPIPQPTVADEFGHLLIADTFASGRMTNPSHPMAEHFESIYVLQHPTYTSIYPVAQGTVLALPKLLGIDPWWAVWATVGAMCTLLCWMLQGWLPPAWAFLGAFLAGVRLSIMGHWMNTLWGGPVSAVGGALVLGAFPRMIRRPCARDSLLLGLGIAILSQSRPYEGFLLSLPVLGALLWWCLRSQTVDWRIRFRKVILPLGILTVLNLVSIGYYDWRVTGKPMLLPYVLYQNAYGTPQSFIWQAPVPAPPAISQYRDIADNYVWQLEQHQARSSWLGLLNATLEKAALFWSFYFGPALSVPLLFFAWTRKAGRLRFLLVCAAIVLAGTALYPFFFPHYVALICGVTLAAVVQGFRYLRAWRWHGSRAGLFLARALLLIVFASSFVQTEPALFNPAWLLYRTARNRILDELQRMGGKHVILVRYGPNHNFHNSWIYNAADIDRSPVVWARELDDAKNRQLMDYFSGRRFWVVNVDEPEPALIPLNLAR
jgi:hypothetical protein